jgi:uncharacterized protein (TIGR01244 family)
MRPGEVAEKLSISAQPQIEDFAELKRLGFATVINNRPDGEEAGQPGTTAEEAAARAAGLAYVHIPVTGPGMTEGDAQRFRDAIERSPGPAVAHCRTGARSLYLWMLSGALHAHTDTELLEVAAKLGIDGKTTAAWIAAHRSQSSGDNV